MAGILPKQLKTQDNQSSFNQNMYIEYSTTDTVRESILPIRWIILPIIEIFTFHLKW